MKVIQLNTDNIVLKKSTVKKAATVITTVIILIFAVILSQNVHIIAGPDVITNTINNIVAILLIVTSHIAVVLCVSALVFSFIKHKTWISRSISAVVSLIIGANHFYGFLSSMNPPKFVIEHPQLSLVIAAAVSLAYATVIFALFLLVQYIYKKQKGEYSVTDKNDL